MPLLPTLPDLRDRRVEPELMDAPELDRARHLDALEALGRVNAVSLAAGRVWTEVDRLARAGKRPVRVLDVACGGGDVLLSLARRARRRSIDIELHGCDVSGVALERARFRGGDALGVSFVERDVLSDDLPRGFDVVCCSLFLHHLQHGQAVRLLMAMAASTDGVLLVQDLRRTRVGYLFAWAGLGVLTSSDVARHDGLVSVAAALTLVEVQRLCDDAGLRGASVRRCWPQRFLVRWTPT